MCRTIGRPLLFDTCCGCIKLRTGCLIIGFLNVVSGIGGIVLGLAFAVGEGKEIPVNKDLQDKLNKGGNIYAVVLGLSLIIISILNIAFTYFLLVGILKNNRGHVKTYLIYAVIFLVLYVLHFFASFGQAIDAGTVVGELITIVLSLYFFLVIRSYFYKMNVTNR